MGPFRRFGFVLFAVIAIVMLTVSAANAQDKPCFLVANPSMTGDYQRTVLLAAPVGDGHIGVILNRPTRVTMGELFPERAPSKQVQDPVYLGGLELRDTIFALYQGEQPHPHALELAPKVWLVFDASAVDAIIEATPNGARYFAGFVEWRPGELNEELSKGYFTVRELEPAKIFTRDAANLFDQMVPAKGQLGV